MPRDTVTATTAPARRIVGREVHGSQVTDKLECGHTLEADRGA